MFYYALSDLACKDTKKLNECCDLIFLETRNFRCLKTNYQEKSFYNKLKQSGLYNLIRAGSVFFVNDVKNFFIFFTYPTFMNKLSKCPFYS